MSAESTPTTPLARSDGGARPLAVRRPGPVAGLFLWELRRHLPAVAGALAVLLALPLLRWGLRPVASLRLAGDAGLPLATLAVFLVAPLLGVYLAGSGWSRERTEGTLGWLYVRPVGAGVLFAVRVAAVLAALALFVGLALLLLRVAPSRVLDDPGLFELGVYRFGLVLYAVVLPAAFFASAVGGGFGTGAVALLGAVGGAFVAAAVPRLLVPYPDVLLADPGAVQLRSDLVLWVGAPLALLAGAWLATRRAVADARSRHRGVTGAATVALVAVLLAAAGTLWQVWGDPLQPVAVRSLGGEARLQLLAGHGLRPDVLRLEVVRAGGGERRLDLLALDLPAVSPDGGALVKTGATEWALVGEDASVRRFELPRWADPTFAVGWSPDGRRFAFHTPGWGRSGGLLLVEPASGEHHLVPVAVPPGAEAAAWRARWADGTNLLVHGPAGSGSGAWWSVVSVQGDTVHGPQRLPQGRALESTAAATVQRAGRRTLLQQPVTEPRREGGLLLWRVGPEGRDLVRLAPGTWELETLASRPAGVRTAFGRRGRDTLGSLGDGTAVWVEARGEGSPRSVVRLAPGRSDASVACGVPDGFLPGSFRGAGGGSAYWWPVLGDGTVALLACDLGAGEARTLDDLGPWGPLSADLASDGLLRPGVAQ